MLSLINCFISKIDNKPIKPQMYTYNDMLKKGALKELNENSLFGIKLIVNDKIYNEKKVFLFQ